MINKLSDLKVGKEYYILLIKDKKFTKKAIIEAIINEEIEFKTNRTEIYVTLLHRNKFKSTNLFFAKEIGIGENKEEAYNNYGKFDFEENENFEHSFKSVIEKN
jgi:hypothetical protein